MSQLYPASVQRLISEFNHLPGIGARSAERLAFYVLSSTREDAMGLALAIRDVKQNIRACQTCYHVTDSEHCHICTDSARDLSCLCVVELPRDVIVLEKCNAYRGLYHVLQGKLDPVAGINPENLRIAELLQRAESPAIREIILALNPTTEGDATAKYISDILQQQFPNLIITHLARGLASGIDLENAAMSSLNAAFIGRAVEPSEKK